MPSNATLNPSPQPPAEPASPSAFAGKRRSLLIGLTAAGMLAYALAAVFTDRERLGQALQSLGWSGMLVILLLSLLNYGLRFARWDMFITRLSHRLPVRRHALYYLSGFTYTISPGKIGEAMRSVYLREHEVTLAQSFAAMFAERIQDLGVVLLLATLVVLTNARYLPLVIGVAVVLSVLGALVASGRLSAWIDLACARLRAGRMQSLLQSISKLLHSSAQLLQPRPLLIGVLLGLGAWVAEGIGFHLICGGLGIHVTLTTAVGCYALALLAGNAAIFLPGGIGGTEIVLTALLTAQGASLPTAVIATLLCRLATLWFAVVVGFIATFMLELGPARKRAQAIT